MEAVFVLYDRMTALDLVGPYEVLAAHPEVEPRFAAARPGPVRCDSGLVLHADTAFDQVDAPDLVVVPGSSRWLSALEDDALVAWLAAVCPAAGHTVSVCTGATLLAKAGLLDGRRATTHWVARPLLASLGADVGTERVVTDGNLTTCAGVSAGIDMALALAARLWDRQTAEILQLALEYDPRPPFDSGSPDKAAPEAVAAIRALLNG